MAVSSVNYEYDTYPQDRFCNIKRGTGSKKFENFWSNQLYDAETCTIHQRQDRILSCRYILFIQRDSVSYKYSYGWLGWFGYSPKAEGNVNKAGSVTTSNLNTLCWQQIRTLLTVPLSGTISVTFLLLKEGKSHNKLQICKAAVRMNTAINCEPYCCQWHIGN